MREGSTGSLVPPKGWLGSHIPVEPVYPGGFVLLATALGAVLRLGALTRQSLWVDEMLTWRMIRPDAGLHFLEQVRDAIQGPLYVAVVWPAVRLGDPEVMLRLPAAVAGALTVPAFAAVAARLVAPRAARLAVALAAINPFLVWYSQEARGYAFVVLFGTLMTLGFLRLRERGPNPGDAALFAAASAATVWSNMSGLFLWVALGASLAFAPPRDARALRSWVAVFAVGLLAALPWLLRASGIWAVERIVPGTGTGEALRGETTLDPFAVPYAVFTFFYGFSLGPSLRELHLPERAATLAAALPWVVAGAAPVLAGALAGLARGGGRRRDLLVWIVVPFAIVLFLAFRNFKPWNARYVAVTLPWILCLVAAGLVALPRRVGTAGIVLLCGLTLWSLGSYYADDRYARADVRGAVAWIEAQEDAARPVLVPVVASVYRFYARGAEPVLDAGGAEPLRTAGDADAYVAGRLGNAESAWVVLARDWHFDPRGLLVPALSRSGHLRLAAERPGVRVFAWRNKRDTELEHGR